jgi:hypothetical protein
MATSQLRSLTPGTKGLEREAGMTKAARGVPRNGVLGCAAFLLFTITVAGNASAQAGDAERILKAMSDYLTSQKAMMASFDTDIEVITPDLQKIQFASSGKLLLRRPDKLRFSRTGGYADIDVTFDGKTLTVYGKNLQSYAQFESPGTIDQIIGRLRDDYNVGAPGADFLLSSIYDELIEGVIEAKYIGRGVIDGIECEHLAFRNADTDWQIWIELGERPVPRKYVITSKVIAGAPQYTLRIKDWASNVGILAETFEFQPPEGAMRLPLEAMASIDEVPLGVAASGERPNGEKQ